MYKYPNIDKLLSRRTFLLSLGKGALFSSIFFRLVYLQLFKSDQYKVLAEKNRISLRLIPPLRGKILNTYVEDFNAKKNSNGNGNGSDQRTKALSKMISSNEILTLINALGLDPKSEEIDLKDLRYGKVIIMTDADVDGSHIRTLLLTFFFNELRHLVKEGYVYIAQPPLYKVKRGKKEEYVNSDEELNNLIINNAITGLKLTQRGKKKTLEGDGLFNILMQHIETTTLIDKLSKQIGDSASRALSQYKVITKTDANNKKKLDLWVKGLSRAAKKLAKESGNDLNIKLVNDEDSIPYISIHEGLNGSSTEKSLPVTFLKSLEYKTFIDYQKYHKDFPKKVSLSNGDGSTSFESITECLDHILHNSKKGQSIQRYKGLGEMNPAQLWETTLDPNTRSLVKVKVDDTNMDLAIEAFATLMGDEVAPRREFIEENALNVSNLDV